MSRLTERQALDATYRYISRRTWPLSDDDWAALREQEKLAAEEDENF